MNQFKTGEILLSIIVPVYNVELYVERCLLSCLKQNISSNQYEIIVVNDGTQDNSLAIVERIANQYSNITIVSQTNAGLSAARNHGLSLASGEYVWFVDSDDWISENSLLGLCELLINNQLDVCLVSAAMNCEGRMQKRYTYSEKFQNQVMQGKVFLSSRVYQACAPFSIYRRNFLMQNKLFFMNGVYHEDSEFTPRAYYLAERVLYYDKVLYTTYPNPLSITRSVNPKKIFDIIKVSESLLSFSNQYVETLYKPIFNNLIARCINSALYQMQNLSLESRKEWIVMVKKNGSIFEAMSKCSIAKYRLEGIAFVVLPTECCIPLYSIFRFFV